MSGNGSKFLAWFIRPRQDKRGGQIAPRNAPVPQTSTQLPEPPPLPVTLTRRADLDRLRYFASKLREGEQHRLPVAFAIEAMTNERERQA